MLFPNLKPYEKALRRLRKLHRDLSRKEFRFKNRFEAKVKLAKAYEHLKELRKDVYMRLGKHFAEKYDVVVMEDIQVKQLVGKSSRRLRLHDVVFPELKSIIRYQMEKYDKKLVLIEPIYTSKTCASCWHVKGLTLSDRMFVFTRGVTYLL